MNYRRSSNWLGFFVSTLAVSALFPSVVLAEGTRISAEQFQSQAKKSWQLLKEKYLEGTSFEFELRYDGDPSSKITVIIRGKNELNHFFRTPDDPDEEIEARNLEYCFKIDKAKAEETWILQDFRDDPVKCENPQFLHGLLETSTFAFRGLFLEEGWLETLVISDSFKIHSIKSTVANNVEYVEVTFGSEHYLDKNNKILGGTMAFDPARYWILIESDVRIDLIYQLPFPRISSKIGLYRESPFSV